MQQEGWFPSYSTVSLTKRFGVGCSSHGCRVLRFEGRRLVNLRFFISIVIVCAFFGASTVAVGDDLRDQPRFALVIGNANYAKAPLANPVNDAKLMSDTLRRVGFDVIERVDANAAQIKSAFRTFTKKLRKKDSIGVFYYAGHGVQVDGKNYLIPLGASISTNKDVRAKGLQLSSLLRSMGRTKNKLNVAILDACRDNPFGASDVSQTQGLAPVDAPSRMLIAYATAPGKVAYDGSRGNSPYSAALAKAIPATGLGLEEVFHQTRREVIEVTGNLQLPWEHSSLTEKFFFNPRIDPLEAVDRRGEGDIGIGEAELAELRAWEKIKASRDLRLLRDHLSDFPGGLFAELVATRIAALERVAPDSRKWSWIITGAPARAELSHNAQALYEQGLQLESGGLNASRRKDAFDRYKKAASLGLPAAMYRLARAYDKGLGVDRDIKRAAKWYVKAADSGHAGAMASAGTLYEFGEGVDKSVVTALVLYRQAAEKGDRDAMTSLGYLYAEGKGVAKDERQARRWYGTAADLGQRRAMYNLALMLRYARGGRSDKAAAARWFAAAANKGHAGAMRQLAFLYDEGRGIARDPKRAAQYYLKSVQAGYSDSLQDVREKRRRWRFSTKREMQKLLSEMGHYKGFVHGFLDRRTRRALIALAERHADATSL